VKRRALTWLAPLVSGALTFAAVPVRTAIPSTSQAQQGMSFGVVQGTVTMAGTNEPLPDVQITVNLTAQQARGIIDAAARGDAGVPAPIVQAARGGRANAPVPITAVTDTAGHFSITVPEGPLSVQAQLTGYFGPPVNGISPDVVMTSAVASSRQPAQVKFVLIQGGTINGRVTDQSGKTLTDALVGVVRRIYRNGNVALDVVDGRPTDDRGTFRLYRLAPGEYYVAALTQRGPAPTAPTNSNPEVRVTTFYPSATDAAAAIPVTVKSGDDLPGIDIQLRTALTYTIRGRVTSTLPPGSETSTINGTVRQPAAILNVIPRASMMLPDVALNQTTANADGTFEIRGIMPGSYDLLARMPAATGWGPQNGPDRATNPWAFGRTQIEVRGNNVENVAIVVHQGMDVKGRTTLDGNPAAPAIRITLLADDDVPVYNSFYETIGIYAPFLDAEGGFTLPVIPEGHFQVRVNLTGGPTRAPLPNAQGQLPPTPIPLGPNSYVADITQNGVSVFDSGLTIASDPVGPIEIAIKSNGGSVEGTVLDADRKPVPGMTVVLVPDTSHRQNASLYRTVASDERGHFVLTRVKPDAYKVFAWDNVIPGAYQNGQFIARYEGQGVRVTVGAGGTVTADVPVIRTVGR